MYDRKKNRSAQNVMDVSFCVVATPLRGRVTAPRASSTSRVLGCVWIVAKVHLTKILVMTQRLVFVWMVAIFWHANEL